MLVTFLRARSKLASLPSIVSNPISFITAPNYYYRCIVMSFTETFHDDARGTIGSFVLQGRALGQIKMFLDTVRGEYEHISINVTVGKWIQRWDSFAHDTRLGAKTHR
ncbi:hypothetical protein VIBNISO65_1370034 [Vibrio nigripulchritudo SO65]|nr:hypothetical protein VIBNISO65_1370034 [Vibrio nigripulchritudo SO65]